MRVFECDVLVVGAGIAGLTAAIYPARQRLRTIIVSMDIGGQLNYVSRIENFPGFPEASGREIIEKLMSQVRRFGASVVVDEVTNVSIDGDRFVVDTRSGTKFSARAVVVCCGKAPKKLGVPGEDEYRGRGVSYCVLCDAPLFRGRRILFVAEGVGLSHLSMLSSIAKEVFLVTSSSIDVSSYSNVYLYRNAMVKEIAGDGRRVRKAVIVDENGKELSIDVDGVFIELGFETRIDFVRHLVDVNEKNEIIVDSMGRTRTRGLFAGGDVVATPYKQAVIAAATGAIAGISATRYVLEEVRR